MKTPSASPGLRDRKRSKTREDLLAAFLALLEESPLDRISVESICAKAGYSRATFFIHFGGKEAILDYFVTGWCYARSVELAAGEYRGREGIARLFSAGADRPYCIRLLCAIVHYYTGLSEPPSPIDLEEAERSALHPRAAEFPGLEIMSIGELCDAYLRQFSDPELAPNLVSIFFGLPLQLYLEGSPPYALAAAYERAVARLL